MSNISNAMRQLAKVAELTHEGFPHSEEWVRGAMYIQDLMKKAMQDLPPYYKVYLRGMAEFREAYDMNAQELKNAHPARLKQLVDLDAIAGHEASKRMLAAAHMIQSIEYDRLTKEQKEKYNKIINEKYG